MKVLQRSYCFLLSTTSIVVNNIKRCNAALPPDIGYCEDAGGKIRDDVSIYIYIYIFVEGVGSSFHCK